MYFIGGSECYLNGVFFGFLLLNFGRWWGSMNDIIEVFFGFLLLNLGRWWGFLNDTLSFYESRLIGGKTQEMVGTLKSYLP